MKQIRFRCSSIGKLMTEPKTKAEGLLSVGAKTYVRELAAQEIFGVDFEVASKQMEKGILVEDESIAILNRVRGLNLVKNTERRTNEWITGECDLYDPVRRRGYDIKSSWSLQTFPLLPSDCHDKLYEYQMRGYMMLWDCDEWSVDYVMTDTPEHLCKYEPPQMHMVGHIPERQRVTSWVIQRDLALEGKIKERVEAAREYMAAVILEFEQTHGEQK